MDHLTIEEKIRALDELQENISHHHKWALALNRTLICGKPPSDDTLLEDAHCRCKLGQWLGSAARQYFEKHHRFDAILQTHEDMHDRARELALAAMHGEPISETAYDRFLENQNRLREEIQKTHNDLYDAIIKTDPLTGAETRVTMNARLQDRLSNANSDHIGDWFVMMDLDHFKRVNDTYGHSVGDEVLARVASTVRTQIRTHDLFFRYGGEEFLLCIGEVDCVMAFQIAERIRRSIASGEFNAPNGNRFTVTASFGLVRLMPGLSVIDTIDRADAALYEAKNAGRNRVQMFEGTHGNFAQSAALL
jgi:diguanylate cyclase